MRYLHLLYWIPMNAELPSRYKRVGPTPIGLRQADTENAKVEPTFNFQVDDLPGSTPHTRLINRQTSFGNRNRNRIGIFSCYYIALTVIGSFILLIYHLALVGVHRGIWTVAELNAAVHSRAYLHVMAWSASLWIFSGILCGTTLAILAIRRVVLKRSNRYFVAAFLVQLVPWMYLLVFRP